MSAESHGNPGVERAAGIIAILAALGIGLFIAGMGLSGAGSGVAGFINNVGDALDNHPRLGMLLAFFALGLVGGVVVMTLKAYEH